MIARRGVLLGALALPFAARAQQFAGTYEPQASAIGDGIWMVRGADEAIGFANGGAIANTVIMASDAGAILVDTGPSLAFGRALEALARRLTGQPVGRIYITHLHPDHSFGNGAFSGTPIHSLPATRAELERDGSGFADAMYRMLVGWMTGTEVVLPLGDVTGGDTMFGGRSLRLLALDGHSEGDLAILDHASGTLLAGDLVFHDRAPATPHADFARWQASLERLEAVGHRQLVPGHGPLDTSGKAIAQTRDWLGWLETSLRRSVASGLDMAEAANLPIPDRFAGIAAARYELTRSVSHFYPRLEAELLPRVDG
ncbi:quinoprotein relay system zinc metallohydrolase 1 [Erythrobacter dokdonensis]|uniref:Beta-lactamase domain-containing protein n=1 Tax=Erythrobacter dokdonensis DSW-74 TaxID=1300349 RepID=A0A1A7BH96_9SPHN|nr:quinoprotein relay system zinc metallohydrolase 1 [Erythrobacter dokdonensis]OBV11091.1 Beta-lactamase domain-containing protein [Erythrobacter dokdonensis DSW-74]